MWLNKEILNEDLENISKLDFIPWDKMANKSILVTGATGLIGFNLVCALIHTSRAKNLNLKIIAQIRNEQKAKRLFVDFLDYKNLEFQKFNITDEFKVNTKLDYIIHGANPTASEYFVSKPVELIAEVVSGTKNILELAKAHKIESLVYLSTMEIYGAPLDEKPIYENAPSMLDSMALRSSYPEAKRLAETLCTAYASEHGINAKVARLAQCFGPGVNKNDNRVFADFARCVLEKRDIELLTAGTSKRPCIYTADVVSAILTILLKGKKAEAYNVGNEQNYGSIKEMAELVASELSNNKILVKILNCNKDKEKFPAPFLLNLQMDKLKNLGWNSRIPLIDMFKRMMK